MNNRCCPICAKTTNEAVCPNCAQHKLSIPTMTMFQLRHRKRRYESGSDLLAKAINALVVESGGRLR